MSHKIKIWSRRYLLTKEYWCIITAFNPYTESNEQITSLSIAEWGRLNGFKLVKCDSLGHELPELEHYLEFESEKHYLQFLLKHLDD